MTERQGGGGPGTTGAFRGTGARAVLHGQLRRRVGRSDLTAVPEVRRALRELLGHWKHRGPADVAELLTCELVTNALIHTDQGAVVTATLAPAGLRVEVHDFTPMLPGPYVPSADDGTHGRGLLLVQALADAWGMRAHEAGKVVWFELGSGTAQGL
ncbi:ATP-binding protein [Streptomyces sp. NPDC059991]|uniref:ATP-binding protein n=1 Tax=Streptomyces sp. NPDC059991 TaxID=3347028 RepID=UPI0036C9AC80